MPTWSTRTSCMRSATVWRRPSRLLTIPFGGAALDPSVESMTVLPFWSMPRPPAANVTLVPLEFTVRVPAAPKPWPTTLTAMVAMP